LGEEILQVNVVVVYFKCFQKLAMRGKQG